MSSIIRVSMLIGAVLIVTAALVVHKQSTSYHLRDGEGTRYLLDIPLGEFRVGFDDRGIEVKSSFDSKGIRMNLSAVGYGESVSPVSAAEVTRKANRIEYLRGNLVEWYVNSPLGLEQGFTLTSPPSKNATGKKLNIIIDVNKDEDIAAALNGHGGAIEWRHRNWDLGIRYGGLYVYDARGKELSAKMQLRNGGITIQVDDTGAIYPIVVDPFIQVAKLTDTDADENDHNIFGNGVSIDGDTAVVGSPFRDVGGNLSQGAAFVFERDNTGMWHQVQMLTADDGSVSDEFGWSVDTDGNRALVGARQGGIFGGNNGAAYIFERNNVGVWTQVQKITASDGALFDFFGVNVSLDGDRAIVAAPNDDINGNLSQGSAYVFERDAMGDWVEVMKLTASDGMQFDSFGTGVSISGDTALVGAQGADFTVGAAYIFQRDAMGAWNEEQKLTASDALQGDDYGAEVSLDGDTAAVGTQFGGSVYIVERNAMGVWEETQKLVPSDGGIGFGDGQLALVGDMLIAGAYADNMAQGSAYIIERNAMGVWEETQKLTPSDEGGRFGLSVSVSGDRVIVGAPRDQLGTDHFRGSAYVFELDTDGDGVPDDIDNCPNSDTSETIIIDGCDSGVENTIFENGCSISDLLAGLAGEATNHGKFVSSVAHLLNQLKKDGVISGSDKGAIQSCAGSAGIP